MHHDSTAAQPMWKVSSPGHRLAAGALACAVFFAAAVALILSGSELGPTAYDQYTYHLPTIRLFAAQWPHPDLSNYNSATTPGYQLLFAAILHYVHASDFFLRLVNALLGCGLIATLLWHVMRRAGALAGLILCAPFVCSKYVFTPAVWLVPHDLGWWAVLGCLLLALRPKIDGWTMIGGAVLLVATVMVRQIHLWAAAPLSLAVLLGNPTAEPPQIALAPRPSLPGRMLAVLLMNLPALAVLAAFVRCWHGFAPPMQQTYAVVGPNPAVLGPNLAVPTLILALVGVFGLFFAGFFVLPRRRDVARLNPPLKFVLCGAVAGLLIGLAPRSTYDFAAGRRSGLWNIVLKLPTYFGRAPLIVGLSTLGGAIAVLALGALPRRQRSIFIMTLAAFVLAMTTSANAWQRYYEPLLLMLFALIVIEHPQSPRAGKIAWAGPILLAILGLAVTVLTMQSS